MFHRKTKVICLPLFLMAMLFLTTISTGHLTAQSIHNNSDVSAARLLEGFNSQQSFEWSVKASQFITQTDSKPYPLFKFIAGHSPEFMPSVFNRGDDERLFAIRAAFNLKGTNYLYIIPTDTSIKDTKKGTKEGVFTYDRDARDGRSFKKGDVIPGIYFREAITGVGIYALGILRNYYIDIEFQNFYGEVFLVSLGNLDYKGWRVLEANVPFYKYVSTRDLATNDYYLRLNKIIIRTGGGEPVNDFDLFFDSLFLVYPVQEDSSEYYDGYKLIQPEVSDAFFTTEEEE